MPVVLHREAFVPFRARRPSIDPVPRADPVPELLAVLVCHCNVVNDHTIRAAVADGAADLDGVTQRCGAGDACGGCVPGIQALLAEAAMAVRDPGALAELQATRRCGGRPVCDRADVAGVPVPA